MSRQPVAGLLRSGRTSWCRSRTGVLEWDVRARRGARESHARDSGTGPGHAYPARADTRVGPARARSSPRSDPAGTASEPCGGRTRMGRHSAAVRARSVDSGECLPRGFSALGSVRQPRRLVARWAKGESLRLAGRLDAAIASLHDVLDDAVSIESNRSVARIRRSLRLAGVRTAAEPRSAQVGALTLTPRETELVALVELGLTNIEIARRLGLGRPTVARMLASAMSKVGADRRSQLAAAMAFATPE